MGRDADIVVVGAGITGVATARSLAAGGARRRPGRAVRARPRSGIEPRRLTDLSTLLFRPALRSARPGRAAELARAGGRGRRGAHRQDGWPRLRPGCASRTHEPSPPAGSATSCSPGPRWPGAGRSSRSQPRPCSITRRRRHPRRPVVSGAPHERGRGGRRRPRRAARDRHRARPRLGPREHGRRRDHGRRLRRCCGGLGPGAARRRRDRASGRSHVRDGYVLPTCPIR